MRILINGVTYDSTKVPVLIDFDENEQAIFNGMKRFVSAPEDSTEDERSELLDKDELKEMYIILSKTQPEIVDFTFYTDKEVVEKRLKELNELSWAISRTEEYWYITVYSSYRNSGNLGKE